MPSANSMAPRTRISSIVFITETHAAMLSLAGLALA
jgi:hypothetical protein